MIRKNCPYYPCHEELEDCTFCYCPLYPCKIESRGYWKKVKTGKLWACEKCSYPHIKSNLKELEDK